MNRSAGSEHLMIFDLLPHAHLPGYVRHLIRYWIEHDLAGQLSFVLWPTFAHDHRDLAQMAEGARRGNVHFVHLTEEERREKVRLETIPTASSVTVAELLRDGMDSNFAALYDWKLYCRYAMQLEATQGLLSSIDSFLPMLAAGAKSPVPLSGIYFKPTFHYESLLGGKAELKENDRAQELRQRFVLARCLRTPDLHTLFVLDPLAVSPVNQIGKGQQGVYLPDPVSLEEVSDSEVEMLRTRSGIEPERQLFLLLGHLLERKGASVVVAAIAQLPLELCEKICLVLVGRIDPPYQAQLVSEIEELLATVPVQIVRRHEFVSEREMAAYFGSADVVLAPYQRHAGMSGILLLAAAAGKPVLSSEYGLMGELVRRYGLGVAVDASDPEAIAAALLRFVEEDGTAWCDRAAMAGWAAEHEPERFASVIFQRLGFLG